MKTKCLIYCTKGKPRYLNKTGEHLLNGKIVAECEVETEEMEYDNDVYVYTTKSCGYFRLQSRSCLEAKQINEYLKCKNGYALHISNLNVFDKPLELSECVKDFKGNLASHHRIDDDWYYLICVQKAHQNMMWVWNNGERKVLISIRPQWVCKILNGEKTIEVRRKVLKGMCE